MNNSERSVKALYIGDLRYTYDSGKTPLFIYNHLDRKFEMDCDKEICYDLPIVMGDDNFILMEFSDEGSIEDSEVKLYSKTDFLIDLELIK